MKGCFNDPQLILMSIWSQLDAKDILKGISDDRKDTEGLDEIEHFIGLVYQV